MQGRTALVTGAAKRIGRAVSRALAEAGVHLALHCRRSRAEAEDLAREAAAFGVRAHVLEADLADPVAAEGLLPRAAEAAGPIDILVNNASIFPEDTLADLTPESVHRNVDVNALAPLLLGRAFAAQNRPGVIVNFLDTMIADYDQKHAAYHLSKRMLFTLTRMMAVEFAPAVRVNAVAPGLVLPPESKDEQYLLDRAHTNPLQRIGSAEGATDAALYLMRAGFVTGQVIFVDGGRHLRGSMYG